MSKNLRHLLNYQIEAEAGRLNAIFRAADAGHTKQPPRSVLKDVRMEAFLIVTLVEGNPQIQASCSYNASTGEITDARLRGIVGNEVMEFPLSPGDPEYRALLVCTARLHEGPVIS